MKRQPRNITEDGSLPVLEKSPEIHEDTLHEESAAENMDHECMAEDEAGTCLPGKNEFCETGSENGQFSHPSWESPEDAHVSSSPVDMKEKARKRIYMRMSVLFFALLIIISLLFIILPRSGRSDQSESETASWPVFSSFDLFEGRYTTGITEYYNSHISVGSTLKDLSGNIRSIFGINASSPAELIESGKKSAADPNTESGSFSTVSVSVVNKKNYQVENYSATDENGYLVVLQDDHWRAFSLYGEVSTDLYADTINYIRNMTDSSIKIYVMPIPSASQFYTPANYQQYNADQLDTYRSLSSKLTGGISCIDIIDKLGNHNGDNIYLRTDHHWSALGAYYAAERLSKAASVNYAPLSSYEHVSLDGYSGDMYEYTGSENILKDTETFEYYIPTCRYIADYFDPDMNFLYRRGLFFDTGETNAYYTFLGTDNAIIKIHTDAGNNRKLLMVTDSYGKAMAAFLTSSYKDIYVIDQRYCNINLLNFIDYTHVTDILFAHNYSALSGSQTDLMEYITYSNLDVFVDDDAPAYELPVSGNPDVNGNEVIYANAVID